MRHPVAEHDITLTVDGTEESLTVESRTLLVHALRDRLGRTAPKIGCESGKCGACTVHLDGNPVKSCLVLAVQADGAAVHTAAGLADDDTRLHPVQAAFKAEHGLQCGYCTPGMLMSTLALLEETSDPTREEIRAHLKGNVCRCTGYQNVVDAVERAARELGDTDDGRSDAIDVGSREAN